MMADVRALPVGSVSGLDAIWRRPSTHRGLTVQRRVPQLGLGLMFLVLVCLPVLSESAAAQEAAVTGVVRDVQGIAQAGALVQILAAGLDAPRTAFTDIHGRYSISDLPPGKYAVQASAALFVPSTKDNLQLLAGKWSVVNLTLASLFDTTGWLPVERRRSDTMGDDWKWTLRSSANRPMLRMLDDKLAVTLSSNETKKVRWQRQVRASISGGDGGFGYGGSHTVLAQDIEMGGGSLAVMRLDVGVPTSVGGVGPSTEMDFGFSRQLGFAGSIRTVASFTANPAILSPGDVSGMQALQVASAQEMTIGDMVRLEAGGEFYAVRTIGYGLGTAPFVRVSFAPKGAEGNWTIGYRMATAQMLQGFDDLNSVRREVPVAVASPSGVTLEHGTHQELSLLRKAGRGTVQVTVYRDDMDHPAVAGGGVLAALAEPAAGAPVGGAAPAMVLTDGSDGSFRFLGPGYVSNGFNVQLAEPLSVGMWAAVEYSTGSALTAGAMEDATPGILPGLHRIASQAATMAVRGTVARSQTKLRAAYRWQPSGLVTAIDPYRAFSDQAYLSLSAWQPIHLGRLLPPGLEGRVDITNLLAQGYRPFLSADGRTLYLAQAPRTMEAGLCVTF
jgi:Carboxypeptidase regulatory-like domain